MTGRRRDDWLLDVLLAVATTIEIYTVPSLFVRYTFCTLNTLPEKHENFEPSKALIFAAKSRTDSMAVVYVTRRERFNAAHKLWNPEWSREKNFEVFGKCANENWHGHNYELYVTLKGEPDPETGYVADLKWLSDLINEKIIEKVDHKNLNLDVPFMKGIMASTENLGAAIWKELEPEISEAGCQLHKIELRETENNYVEYYGE